MVNYYLAKILPTSSKKINPNKIMNKIETAMSFFKEKDLFPNTNNQSPVNKEFKNILLASIKENYDVKLDKNKKDFIFDEVDKLSSLVEDKRPELKDVEKLTLLDEMFHVKFNADKFRDEGDNSLSSA